MAHLLRRTFTTTARTLTRASASEASAELLTRFNNAPISTRTQLLDANQLHLLQLTLNPSISSSRVPPSAPPDGTPIPPGHHLVYFTPALPTTALGADGTDLTVNPLRPFTRRMWAGGELEWTQSDSSLLRVGQTVTETTRLVGAEAKTLRSGDEMLVVGVEKTYEHEGGGGIALVDRRNWVFQREIETVVPPKERPESKPFPKAETLADVEHSFTDLFRFSALTFNAHKIHLSPEWCRSVEGHRDCVVHGPLNLIHMLDLWREKSGGGGGVVPKSVQYRALAPLYVSERYRILMRKVAEGNELEIWDGFGKMAMKGFVVA